MVFCLFNEGPESLRVCGEAFIYDVIDVAVVRFFFLTSFLKFLVFLMFVFLSFVSLCRVFIPFSL